MLAVTGWPALASSFIKCEMVRCANMRAMAEMRFECQRGCTACCEQKGFVYLSEDDVPRIAGFLGMAQADFERLHVYRTKNFRRLRVPRESQCSFLRDYGCSIHEVKPVQCRAFPFWPELLANRKDWGQTGKYCPGIGKGELVQIEAAQGIALEMKAAYGAMY